MCEMCDGASRDEVLFNLHGRVERHGWALQGVQADKPSAPTWVYSIGLAAAFDHPELVVVNVDPELSALALNELGRLIRDGQRLTPGEYVRLSGARVRIGPVHPDHLDRGLMAMWSEYYEKLGGPIPPLTALQVFFPPEQFCACHPTVSLRLPNAAAGGMVSAIRRYGHARPKSKRSRG